MRKKLEALNEEGTESRIEDSSVDLSDLEEKEKKLK